MPRNPLYNNGRADAQNNGLTHDNKASEPKKSYRQGYNTFNNSYKHVTTERYADVSPFMVLDCVSRDKIPFRSIHKLASYTMKSPMMDEIYKHKFYSLVPYRAILPNTWELFYTNPTKGDDVPDDVYCNIDILKAWSDYAQNMSYFDSRDPLTYHSICYLTIASELIFSTGSLFSKLKYNFWQYGQIDNTSFDNAFDNLFAPIVQKYYLIQRELQPGVFELITSSPDLVYTDMGNARLVSVRTMLDILRNGDYANAAPYFISEYSEDVAAEFQALYDYIYKLKANVDRYSDTSYPIDISRLIAYQITCVSQVTDSSIDYIFNANLFRNVLFPQTEVFTFTWNTQVVLYDTFSRKYLEKVWFNPDNFLSSCQKLFSYGKSLKFGDYFTQARPQPYAVGDLTIDTSNGTDAVKITRQIVYQRFLNWNNRVGPKYEDYHKELTGMDAMPDITEPSIINHSKGVVSGFQVENTGDAQLTQQNSVTTLLRDTGGNFEFDILVSEPSILLGLTCYDVERLYTRIMDRANLKESRFDFFNHMLQYVGDQDIKACELDAMSPSDVPIAYTTRDMHYKQQVSHASAGFIHALPSWAFTNEESDNDLTLALGINPEFIRNVNADFDRFFSSLSGYSLGNYFHFILKYNNDFTDMQRAMDVAPDIL